MQESGTFPLWSSSDAPSPRRSDPIKTRLQRLEVAPTATNRTLGIGHLFFFLPGENKNTRNLGDLIDGIEPGQGAKVPVTYFV